MRANEQLDAANYRPARKGSHALGVTNLYGAQYVEIFVRCMHNEREKDMREAYMPFIS